MSKDKSKEKELEELAEWCHCEIHDIDYPCNEGCPECKLGK
jgi:hypothetical protein